MRRLLHLCTILTRVPVYPVALRCEFAHHNDQVFVPRRTCCLHFMAISYATTQPPDRRPLLVCCTELLAQALRWCWQMHILQ